MTESEIDEIEKLRHKLFEDGYRRNQEWKEKITAGIQPTEAEASYPVSIRLRLEEQRQLLRDILIEGNNLLSWREATTDLDDLKKELYIYASKRHSKTPGDSSADYAFDIVRRIELYRDRESLIKIEAEKPENNNTLNHSGEDETASEIQQTTKRGAIKENPDIIKELTRDYFRFDLHVPWLIKNNYLEIDKAHLIWKKGGLIMLAAYFGMLQEDDRPLIRKCKWAPIEKFFLVLTGGELKPVRNLAQLYKDFEEVKKCKSNKHDAEYKELKSLIEEKQKI
jgi:hypothetical protein